MYPFTVPSLSSLRGPATLLLFLSITVGGVCASAEAKRYEIDPDHLSIGFLVEHVGYSKVLGMFLTAQGSFSFDEETGELTDLVVSIDTSSVFTNHQKRDEHLRSPDFLNSTEFPNMAFRAATAETVEGRRYEIEGELELLGQTKPVTLDGTWNKSGEYPFAGSPYVMGVSARGSFLRSAFGMTYSVDNGWVGDEVTLIIEFEAQRQ